MPFFMLELNWELGMIVYRICNEEEYNLIMNNEFRKVGRIYDRESMKNTNNHKYCEHISYMHFFPNIESTIYLRQVRDSEHFLCAYEISDGILSRCVGEGYYVDLIHMVKRVPVKEYAVPSCMLSIDNLVSVDRILDTYDIDDYIDDPSLSIFFTNVYKSNGLVKRSKLVKSIKRIFSNK